MKKLPNTLKTYLQYGVPSDIAEGLIQKGIPVTTLRTTSISNLVNKYHMDMDTAKIAKRFVLRQPIDEDIVQMLLENSNYTCCCCKGTKSTSYIIHHIEEHAKTQDNSYANLAVLCPTCHDIAHHSPGLTNKLTPEQIQKSKWQWHRQVEKANAEAAATNGEIHETDYLNVPRIQELAYSLYKHLPATLYSEMLLREKIINTSGELLPEAIANKGISELGFSSWKVRHHFLEIFQSVMPRIKFENLDDLLNKRSLLRSDFIGTFCFYIGALYGKGAALPEFPNGSVIKLHFHRKGFYCEWRLDPLLVTSTTAFSRFTERSIFLAYGRIKSVGPKVINGKEHIAIDIRPYVIGVPTKQISRTPVIAYIRNPKYQVEPEEEEVDSEEETD
jgi:5-methylcytosine-specific restriction endonuclease McrA